LRARRARPTLGSEAVSGGLIDIEFAAQYFILAHAHAWPELLDVSTRATLAKAGELGLISSADAASLVDAHRLYTDATQIMRLTVAGPFDAAQARAASSAASRAPRRCRISRCSPPR